jgi:hypothetical protein
LAERSEPRGGFDADGELPGEEDVLLDTPLYHAAAERVARALVRRERVMSGASALLALAATASV